MSEQRDGIDGSIDAYLDALLRELRVERRRLRRILVETEDHLREAAARGLDAGLTPEDAVRQAIDAFGSPRAVARRFAAEDGRLLLPSLLLHLVLALALLGGVGLAAIGVSGGVAAGMGAAFGKGFVSGDLPDVAYTPQRCADLFEYFPHAANCEAAATAHHFDEVVQYRLAAGVLGLLVLAGYALVRWRYPRLAGVRMLPDGFTATVGVALFGVAAAIMLFQSVGRAVFTTTTGSGAYLSGGIIAALVFLGFAGSLARTLCAGEG